MRWARLLFLLMVTVFTSATWWTVGRAQCVKFADGEVICNMGPCGLQVGVAMGDSVGWPGDPGKNIVTGCPPPDSCCTDLASGQAVSSGVDVVVSSSPDAVAARLAVRAYLMPEGVTAMPARLAWDKYGRQGSFAPFGTRIERSVATNAHGAIYSVIAQLPREASQGVKLAIANRGSVVWHTNAHLTGTVAKVSGWPMGIRSNLSRELTYAWRFGRPGPIQVKGSSGRDTVVTGDELRVIGPGASSMVLGGAQFKSTGISSLTLSHPTVVRPSAESSHDAAKPATSSK